MKTKEIQEIFHSGWCEDKAKVCIKASHLALANQFMNENYEGQHYNVLNENKVCRVINCHHQVKGEKYCYTIKLIQR